MDKKVEQEVNSKDLVMGMSKSASFLIIFFSFFRGTFVNKVRGIWGVNQKCKVSIKVHFQLVALIVNFKTCWAIHYKKMLFINYYNLMFETNHWEILHPDFLHSI